MNKQYQSAIGARGASPEVRAVYNELRDRNLEKSAKDLGILIDATDLIGASQGVKKEYKQLLESVWIPKDYEPSQYYTAWEKAKIAFSSSLSRSWAEQVKSQADSYAVDRAKSEFKGYLIPKLKTMLSDFTKYNKNCHKKIAEISRERDVTYQKSVKCEGLALKELQYISRFEKDIAGLKKDAKKLSEKSSREKICDCERKVNEMKVQIDDCRRNAKRYAHQNKVYSKMSAEAEDNLEYLRFLKGRYLLIQTKIELMLAQITNNEFNIENCLMEGEQIKEYNEVMAEAEDLVIRQEDAQEGSIEFALNNFGFTEDIPVSSSWKETVGRAKEQDEKDTDTELKHMDERRKKRLDDLLKN